MDAINNLLSSAQLPFGVQTGASETSSTADSFMSVLEQVAESESSSDSGKERIEQVASDFESVFLSLLLKEMRNTLDQENGGLFGGEGSDTMGGMFDMFMGKHLADASPLGISNAVESYLGNMP